MSLIGLRIIMHWNLLWPKPRPLPYTCSFCAVLLHTSSTELWEKSLRYRMYWHNKSYGLDYTKVTIIRIIYSWNKIKKLKCWFKLAGRSGKDVSNHRMGLIYICMHLNFQNKNCNEFLLAKTLSISVNKMYRGLQAAIKTAYWLYTRRKITKMDVETVVIIR